MTDIVETTRRTLGRVGAFLPSPTDTAPTVEEQRNGARRLEQAGYPAAWTNEAVGGKDAMVQLGLLLGATERLAFGTGIANIWARPPQTAHAAAALLAQAYPGRLVLGLGVGYPEQAEAVGRAWTSPVATMRAYLRAMAAPSMLPAPDAAYPRLVAANGPRLLEVARDEADGVLPAMQPPELTASARRTLGSDKLLVVLVRTDPGQAAADVAVDVDRQIDAGADHVVLTLPLGTPFGPGLEHLERVAPR